MKRIICFALILSMLTGVGNFSACAQSASDYTADELAYIAYVDIGSVYYSGLSYLDVLGGLWESLLDKDTWDDVNSAWLLEYQAANMDFNESIRRNMLLVRLANEKFGYEDAKAFLNTSTLIDEIKKEAEKYYSNDPMQTIFIMLEWAQEIGYLKSTEDFENELKMGMDVIRKLMVLDAQYAYLNVLKEYYKEASAIYEYLADFSDNYISFTEKLKQYHASYDSWEIEFDFMLGSDAYETYGDAYRHFVNEQDS